MHVLNAPTSTNTAIMHVLNADPAVAPCEAQANGERPGRWLRPGRPWSGERLPQRRHQACSGSEIGTLEPVEAGTSLSDSRRCGGANRIAEICR